MKLGGRLQLEHSFLIPAYHLFADKFSILDEDGASLDHIESTTPKSVIAQSDKSDAAENEGFEEEISIHF